MCSLEPSPPNSPIQKQARRAASRLATKPESPVALVQIALRGEVKEYVTPVHTWGEQFPGRQAPTTQLSLFDSGVYVRVKST
tara:strand:- start:1201 stop:1446 length:246 start_codon:yes stop_codon:yes gene_type:complete